MNPTRKADYVKVGDTCTGGHGMFGVVLSVRYDTSLPQVRVQWSSGSVGTHSITTLRRADEREVNGGRDCDHAGQQGLPVCLICHERLRWLKFDDSGPDDEGRRSFTLFWLSTGAHGTLDMATGLRRRAQCFRSTQWSKEFADATVITTDQPPGWK